MSLQVWLPLNNDLHNQGLTDITVINNGATINNSGKIGKCYSFDGNNQYLKATNINTISTDVWSLAAWVYPTADTTSAHQYIVGMNTSTSNDFLGVLCYYQNKFGVRIKGTTYSAPTTSAHNVWYHVTAIYNNTILKLYINGILIQTWNSTITPVSASTIYVGMRGGGFGYFNGLINDVRIYDHALSDKEVEEIAKGLVLHYKLDSTSCPNKNLLKSIQKAYNPTTYCAYQLNLTEKLELNQPYTIQLWDIDVSHTGKTEDQLGVSVYLGGGSNNLCSWFGPENFVNGHADYLVKTFKRTSWDNTTYAENLWLNIYNSPSSKNGDKYMHIGAWKLEKGEVPTGWGGEENICYDSSGYDNDGTIIGSLSIIDDTARYNYAVQMNNISTNNHIECNNELNLSSSDDLTITFWLYPKQSNSYVAYIDKDMSFCVNSAGTYFYVNRVSSKGFPTSKIKINDWNFITLVRQNSNILVYINLENIQRDSSSSSTSWSHNSSKMYLLNRELNNNYAANAVISDFRIYATALTEEQIKELYNTSATIDNLGNIHTREFDENSNLNITKTGLFQASEIKDGDYQIASILKNTNSIQGNNLYEY